MGIFMAQHKITIMKVIKLIFKVIWTISLQNIFLWLGMAWKWAWSKTEVDEKVISAVKETGRRLDNAADEMGDVVDALKGKEINKNGQAKKAKHKKGN
jgi:hypothetical protein